MLECAFVYISPDHGTQQGPTFRQAAELSNQGCQGLLQSLPLLGIQLFSPADKLIVMYPSVIHLFVEH